MKRRLVALFVLTIVLAAVGAGVGTTAKQPAASASALAISIVVPGQPGAGAGAAVAPGVGATAVADSFVYPADGSIVRTGTLASSASARTDAGPVAQAVTDVLSVSLFGGEITLDSAAGRASASSAAADAAGSSVANLVIGGQPVNATPNQRYTLGDWGAIVTLEQTVERTTGLGTNARAIVNALRVTLTAEHAGLPAGSEILVGRAEAATSAPAPAKPDVPAKAQPTAPGSRPGRPTGVPPPRTQRPKPVRPRSALPGVVGAKVLPTPTNISAPLSPEGFVFPLYGDAGFSDSWGAPRASTGRHQGTDIFAPLGTPVLAVADGRLFSIGWNTVGGWRLWLTDRQGNQFYYAHLSAFSALAREGAEVRAGQVVGFNGNSGDAQGTPYHVHFEIHPVALLPLGYKGGAVNPYEYLGAWRRVQDISLAVGTGWAPPVPVSAKAPRPGAFLLGSTDISSASGLEPGSLERALVAPVLAEGDGAQLRND